MSLNVIITLFIMLVGIVSVSPKATLGIYLNGMFLLILMSCS